MKNSYEIRGDVTVIFLQRRDGAVVETLIETSDLFLVNSFEGTWCAQKTFKDEFYCKAQIKLRKGTYTTLLLHRFITGAKDLEYVDHINHNRLDNCRSNLRVVTQSENMFNRKGPQSNSQSGIRGVYLDKRRNTWYAEITLNKKKHWLGTFSSSKEAEIVVQQFLDKEMLRNATGKRK